MFSEPIQNLVAQFLKFPGVGPKQATRFVFYLLREDPAAVQALAEKIRFLQSEVRHCRQCYKTFDAGRSGQTPPDLCEICRNPGRRRPELMIVEKEVDLENIERTKKFRGTYHVLGGTVHPLDSDAPSKLHLKELFERVRALADAGAAEVILATNPTAEGDATALYIARILGPLERAGVKVSRLGRGLTTGSELEYSDEATIANALENRK